LVYGAREDVPKKPDPYSALEISRLSGIATSDFLYLGDSDVDMITANKAGMYAVGAAWGFRDEDELWMNGAKAVIKNPLELLDIVL
jgi:phosphoglycolate phosphatase